MHLKGRVRAWPGLLPAAWGQTEEMNWSASPLFSRLGAWILGQGGVKMDPEGCVLGGGSWEGTGGRQMWRAAVGGAGSGSGGWEGLCPEPSCGPCSSRGCRKRCSYVVVSTALHFLSGNLEPTEMHQQETAR